MKKNLFTKVFCCVLAATMVLGLAACGQQEEQKESSKTPASSGADSSSVAASESEEEREAVELVWYTFVSSKGQGEEATMKAVNEYLSEKLNTTIDAHFYTQADYTSTVPNIFNSGTYMDLLTTGSNNVDFLSLASRNAFFAIEDYIDEYLPGTKAALPEAAWDAYTVNGHVYAVPPIKDLAYRWDYMFNKTMLDDLGLEAPETWETAYDLIPFLYDVKEARDAKYPEEAKNPILKGAINYMEAYYFFDALVGGINSTLVATNIPGLPGFEGYGDGETVFCPYYTDEFVEYAKQNHALVADGIASPDARQFDPDGVLFQSGKLLGSITIGNVYVEPNNGYYDVVDVVCSESTLTTSSMQVAGFCIPATSKYPERVLEVIELLQTDEYLATVIRFGPEGQGWTDTDNDGVIEATEVNADSQNRWWWNYYGYQLGSLYATKKTPGTPSNFNELLQELNNNATQSINVGFVFDQTPVANEIAACNNVRAEFYDGLGRGNVEDVEGRVAEFVQKLKENGMDTILKEAQTQLDNWRAEN